MDESSLSGQILSGSVEGMWKAVSDRDPRYDGSFYYAVKSTGIYCRPSCASRKPSPEQVVFFRNARDAALDGFRPCRRCCPDGETPLVKRVIEVSSYIDAHPDEDLTLGSLSKRFGISAYHLQRSFKQVAGVTPRQYAEGSRLNRLKVQLKRGESVRSSTYGSGHVSTGWIYEGPEPRLGMEAGSYKRGGAGKRISFSIVRSSLGHLLVASTTRGVCMVALGDSRSSMVSALRAEYPNASLVPEAESGSAWVQAVVDYIEGKGDGPLRRLPVELQGTAFQRKVWNELRAIPRGSTKSYSQIAERIGRPRAVRAVARACATNPVAVVIPCHRVIGKDGSLKGYRWGAARKKALLRIDGKEIADRDD